MGILPPRIVAIRRFLEKDESAYSQSYKPQELKKYSSLQKRWSTLYYRFIVIIYCLIFPRKIVLFDFSFSDGELDALYKKRDQLMKPSADLPASNKPYPTSRGCSLWLALINNMESTATIHQMTRYSDLIKSHHPIPLKESLTTQFVNALSFHVSGASIRWCDDFTESRYYWGFLGGYMMIDMQSSLLWTRILKLHI